MTMMATAKMPAAIVALAIAAASLHSLPLASAFSAVGSSLAYNKIKSSTSILDPTSGESTSILPPTNNENSNDIINNETNRKTLVVFLPQLGEFDSFEYCEQLIAAQNALEENKIDLKVIGIGDTTAASAFCSFSGLNPEKLFLDPNAELFQELELYAGPNLSFPENDFFSDGFFKFFLNQFPGGVPDDENDLRPVSTAWLNYLAMCAGIGAKGTLREILRGYFGDKNAPERFRSDDVVSIGDFLVIGPGVGPVKIGPFKYNQWFADERGYQRPVEMACVRLKSMVEVLTNWDTYVSNPLTIAQRGGTFLFDENGRELYSYKSTGVLTYSETMARPLMFLSAYIGEEVARNPMQLPDNGGGNLKRGRGILKPAGKAMGLLSTVFKLENKLQAQLLGAQEEDYSASKKEIEETISNNNIVIYTYGLSPFSSEAIAVLDEIGASYKQVEVGLEWFLLDKEKSVLRAELLEMTGQSSLPHVFINGEHVGGLFTGSSDGKYPGLAGLKESGELAKMIAND